VPEAAPTQTPSPPEPAAAVAPRRGTVRYVTTRPLRRGLAEVRGACPTAALLAVPDDPGPVLLLILTGRTGGEGRTRLARVVRAGRQPGSGYLVVCRFTPPLSAEELGALND
jgi:hypothetical protein